MAVRRDLGGFRITDTRAPVLTRLLERRLRQGRQTLLFFANHHFVVQCQHLRNEIQSSPTIIVNDGIGMNLASLVLFGKRFEENLNGTDFTPLFLGGLSRPVKVYLFGSETEVVERAGAYFDRLPMVTVVGCADGFSFQSRGFDVVADINRSGADIVLIGLGNPRQEEWALRNAATLNPKLIIGVGALFEWATGHKIRAPEIIRKFGLEWAYRIWLEPRRLTARYTLGAGAFCLALARNPVSTRKAV
jgi:beta-1,4-glucosyltransferase